MTSYYTGTGDVTRSKLASTWESKPLYLVTREQPKKYIAVCFNFLKGGHDQGSFLWLFMEAVAITARAEWMMRFHDPDQLFSIFLQSLVSQLRTQRLERS